jgi:hypothetical protein
MMRLRQLFAPSERILVALSGHSRSHLTADEDIFDHYLQKPVGMDRVASLLLSPST